MTQCEEPLFERLRYRRIKSKLIRNVLAEFVGTFFLLFIGTSIVSQHHLTGGAVDFFGVIFGWGCAIMFCVMAASKLSGGHFNPAISFMVWSMGHIPFKWFICYTLAQMVGAFLGSLCMYGYYLDLYNSFDGGVRQVLGKQGSGITFCSYPGPHLKGAFMPWLDQFVCTFLLAFFAGVVIDKRNGIPQRYHGLFFNFLIIVIGCGFAVNIGFPMNPARDFGPRLAAFFVYGRDAFMLPYPSYFLAPLFSPFLGSLAGIWLYQLSFGMHIPDEETVQAEEKVAEKEKLMC